MPSKTLKQQHFFQMVKGFQSGAIKPSDLPSGVRAKVEKTAKSISKKASGEFAASVEENDDIDFSVLSFKEYIMAESALVEAFSELTDDDLEMLAEKCSMEDEESKLSKEYARTQAQGRKDDWLADDEDHDYIVKHDSSAKAYHVIKIPLYAKDKTPRVAHTYKYEEDEEPSESKKIMKGAAKRGGKEAHLSELWAKPFSVPKSKRGMFAGKTIAELESQLAALKKSGPHAESSPEFTKEKELNFALRAKRNWKSARD